MKTIHNAKAFFRYNSIALKFLTVSVLIFISLYALFYLGLSFDGAFHSQAAINLYKHGIYILDYPVNNTQIKVPFQIINGFFLTVFGKNFISANLANVFFYILFGGLIYKLQKQYNSQYILLGLILISFSTGFLNFGFKGYGEIPGLIFGLIGLLLLTKDSISWLNYFFGAFLIGASIATKWIFVLILLPYGIWLLLQLRNKKYKNIIYSIIGGMISLTIFWSIEYGSNIVNMHKLVPGILSHSKPVNSHLYDTYFERLLIFWNAYVKASGNLLIAILKVIAYVQTSIIFIYISIESFKKFRVKQTLSSNRFFLLLISLYAIEYFFWWFFFSSKPWYRRGFNADVILIIALSLSIKEIIQITSFNKAFRFLAIAIIIFISIYNVYGFFSKQSVKLFSLEDKGSIILESNLRRGLHSLPENFIPYGYGWWQAPRWSFLSGSKHKKLNTLTLKDKNEIEKGSDKYFVFIEPVNFLAQDQYNKLHEQYKLLTIFEYNNYIIKKIEPKNRINTQTESFIHYVDYDYSKTEGVYSKNNNFCWYSQDAKILLDSKDKHEFTLSYFIPDIRKYSNTPFLFIYFNDSLACKEELTSSGSFTKKINVSKEFQQEEIVVNIIISEPHIAKGDARNLGIAVTKIGFN